MKTIGVAAVLSETAEYFRNQLNNLFGNQIHINAYKLGEINEPLVLTEERLIICPGIKAMKAAEKKLICSCPVIRANRSVNYKRLDELFRLPEGSEVYLFNDFEDSALETVEYLKSLGLTQLRYIPSWPENRNDGKEIPVITVDEFNNLPSSATRIINIGIRTIDISTIIEIMLRLELPQESIYRYTTKYIGDIIALTKDINSLGSQNERMRNRMETVVQKVNDGIISVTDDDKVAVFNHAAEQLFGILPPEVLGKPTSVLPVELIKILSYSNLGAEGPGGIFDFHGKKLVVSMSKTDSAGGVKPDKTYFIREINAIQKLEQSLRMKLAHNKYVTRYSFADILGNSQQTKNAIDMAAKVARFDMPVYIQGESGTGKELYAQAIHAASARRDGPFVAVNFAAITESLLESELFGYADGAFTGARKGGMPGVFEQAHGGTLFLDEIGDAPLSFQVRLLRVLQEKQVRRIGDDKLIPVDVRVITATNRDIGKMVEAGSFRQDLYYRLNVLPVFLAPLRERKEDIRPLAEKFYEEAASGMAGLPSFEQFFGPHIRELEEADYPGNIRQLRNLVTYLTCTSENGICPDIDEDLGRSLCRYSPESRTCAGKFSGGEAAAAGERPGSDRAEASAAPKALNPAPLPSEWLCLKAIYERRIEGKTAGRRSLAVELNCPENQIKQFLEELAAKNLIRIRKGRGGILITDAGFSRLKDMLKGNLIE